MWRGLAIVCISVGLVALSGAVQRSAAGQNAEDGTVGMEFDAQRGIVVTEPESRASVPQAVAEEVWLFPACENLAVSQGGRVIGCSVALTSEDALSQIERGMGDLGWTAVPLGGVAGFTFVKTQGTYRRAVVTVDETGGKTAVVYRLEGENDAGS